MIDSPQTGAAPTRVQSRRRTERIRAVNIGRRQVLIHGFTPSFWTDVYHVAMTVGWAGFLGGLAAVFVLVNAVFAALYWLSPGCVANADGEILKLFFFSVETLTTVGYGEYFPLTNYAHIVVSVETFTGLFFTATMLGLIFARLSRPRARIIFARNVAIGPHDGQPTLVIRVANERLNLIASAKARVWLAMQQRTAENVPFRRFLELQLIRSENPVFTLSWTIMHSIDASSPLSGLGPPDLESGDAFLIVSIAGHDKTSAQEVQSRQLYGADEIVWGHRYADILETTETGASLLDYTRFHDLEAVAGWEMPAGAAAPAGVEDRVSSPPPGEPIASGSTRPGHRSGASDSRP